LSKDDGETRDAAPRSSHLSLAKGDDPRRLANVTIHRDRRSFDKLRNAGRGVLRQAQDDTLAQDDPFDGGRARS
jgi:hypothetical protein